MFLLFLPDLHAFSCSHSFCCWLESQLHLSGNLSLGQKFIEKTTQPEPAEEDASTHNIFSLLWPSAETFARHKILVWMWIQAPSAYKSVWVWNPYAYSQIRLIMILLSLKQSKSKNWSKESAMAQLCHCSSAVLIISLLLNLEAAKVRVCLPSFCPFSSVENILTAPGRIEHTLVTAAPGGDAFSLLERKRCRQMLVPVFLPCLF